MFWIIPFGVSACLNLLYEIKGNKRGRMYTKPLLMPALILFYVCSVKEPELLIITALISGFLGDVFLMFPGKSYLLAGMASFLMGHVIYIFTFIHLQVPGWFYLLLIPYILYAFFIIPRLFSYLKDMLIPAIIYFAFILLMSFSALTRVYTIPVLSFAFAYAGSLFFIISDTILAFILFKKTNGQSDVYVMATYLLAQLFIVIGFILK